MREDYGHREFIVARYRAVGNRLVGRDGNPTHLRPADPPSPPPCAPTPAGFLQNRMICVESESDMLDATTSVRVGDLTFDVAMTGPEDGPPVMLLHGFPETRACWHPVAPLLTAAGLRVYAPDQRGYSPRARPDAVEAYRIEHLVADIIGLLDALDLPRVHLVGHDWGAIVAWFAGVWHPDRVQTLTAVSVPHPAAFGWAHANDADQQQRSSYIKAFRKPGIEHTLLADDAARLRAAFGDAVDPRLVDQHVSQLREPGALTAALSWYRAMTDDFRKLAPVTVPTTFVWSDDDAYLGRTGAERCGQFASGPYRFAELAGVSHWIPEQAPKQLADEVLHRVGTS